jgi:transcriptional regulator with XRE-family HTH domain
MDVNARFGKALRLVRKHRGLSQEDFSDVSSRTYVSSLERGLKSPTLEKVEMLAKAMDLDPLVLLVLAFDEGGIKDIRGRMEKVVCEVEMVRASKVR